MFDWKNKYINTSDNIIFFENEYPSCKTNLLTNCIKGYLP